jgi:aspartate carbamoyltransferase catalytic subunit
MTYSRSRPAARDPFAALSDQVDRAKVGLPRHLITLTELKRGDIQNLIGLADALREAPDLARGLGAGRVLGVLFFQPSTRTRLNFESAMARIGGSSTGFASPDVTRAGDFYQETLEDVVTFTAQITDVLCLRHPETYASRRGALASSVPLISAGDGYNEHPTQGLGDIYTMWRLLGALTDRSIGLLGNTNVRSLKSIVAGLSRLGVGEIVFLLPPDGNLAPASAAIMEETGTPYRFVDHVDELLRSCDLIESIGTRHPNHEIAHDQPVPAVTDQRFRITAERLRSLPKAPPILHPGPRTDEIDIDVDSWPQAQYFEQARNGLWMRAAILACALRMPIHAAH